MFSSVQLKKFQKFEDSAEALQAGIKILQGELCKPLKKILKKIHAEEANEQLMVWDAKLGNAIKVSYLFCGNFKNQIRNFYCYSIYPCLCTS